MDMSGERRHHLSRVLAAFVLTLICAGLAGCSASDATYDGNNAINPGNNGSQDAGGDAGNSRDTSDEFDATSQDASADSIGTDVTEQHDFANTPHPDRAWTGAPCATDADCPDGVCIGDEDRYCSIVCSADVDCPGGWACGETARMDAVCTCEPSQETCDGLDNDCDGLVDEGPGDELGCGDSLCLSNRCQCPDGFDCNGACVDVQDSASHCGGCGVQCDVACNDYSCVGVTAAAVGSSHACALLGDGQVRCFGANSRGQAGTGTSSEKVRDPTDTLWLDDVDSLSSNADQTCAVSNGDVWCWGANDGAVVAPSSARSFTRPIRRPDLRDIESVDLFDATACAVAKSGDVTCWGGANTAPPQTVTNLDAKVVDVALGGAFRCALLDSGAVTCWGQLPIAGTFGYGLGGEVSLTPIPGITSAAQIEAGAEHICARTRAGQVLCLGQNRDGQLGFGELDAADVPKTLGGIGQVADIATGDDHSCAVNAQGDVYCWGINADGQLGDGTSTSRYEPTRLEGLPPARSISAGARSTCAVVEGGDLYCWGRSFGANPRPIQW
jgi:alpha-tubulin suppressor-like RCC1 family protein